MAGVCVGIGDYFGIDANIVRLVFAMACVFGFMGALVYLVAWAVLPEEDEKESIVEHLVNKNR